MSGDLGQGPSRQSSAAAGLDAELREGLEGMANGLRLCRCASRYHTVWAALRAVGEGRGLQSEAPVLDPLLQPLLKDGQHVLIAGAADAKSLAVLHALANGRSVRFSLADSCPAPLRRASDFASQQGITLRSVATDLAELVTDDPWHLVFVHYTLSFADRARRRRILQAVARGLAAGGSIVCAAKFDAAGADDAPVDAARRWLARMHPVFSARLSGQPQAWADLEPLLAGYAQEWAQRKASQPSQSQLEDDFVSAGLVVRERLETPRGKNAKPASSLARHRQYSRILVAGRAD